MKKNAIPLTYASAAFKAGHKNVAAKILSKNYGSKMAIVLLNKLNEGEGGASAPNFQIGVSPQKFKSHEIPSWAKFFEPKLWQPGHILAILGAAAILLAYVSRKISTDDSKSRDIKRSSSSTYPNWR